MREPWSCEVTYLAPGHPASTWRSWDSCLAVWLQSLRSRQLCAGKKNRRRLVSATMASIFWMKLEKRASLGHAADCRAPSFLPTLCPETPLSSPSKTAALNHFQILPGSSWAIQGAETPPAPLLGQHPASAFSKFTMQIRKQSHGKEAH